MRIYRVVPGARSWSTELGEGGRWSGYPRTVVSAAEPVEEWHDKYTQAEAEAARISKLYDHRRPGYQRDDPLPVHVFRCQVDSILDALRGRAHSHELWCVYEAGKPVKTAEARP